ncbi:MAG TPA: 3-hydroxyacyl-CoA dehydrogenase family protein [Syntrophorhabdales bacterium]|nr:3-hydroxyacyl-CoA dehydrogenase family protein [Syntrophorhabdales bacterium]
MTTTEKEHIAVIGAGLMGHGIAQIFALHGHPVSLLDVNDEVLAKAIENVRTNLTLLANNGIGKREEIEGAVRRITTTQDLKTAVSGAHFVVEAVAEQLELKQKLFKEMDELCPQDAILATNTSVISITEIAAKAKGKKRIVGTHFWNPPYLIPLVEVVPGDETSLQTVDQTYDLLKAVGKKAVKVKKDVPGFVGNRLQHALWREAVAIVDQGIADAATVDEVIRNSFGLRLPVLAPLETADMVGLDLTLQIHNYILKYIDRSTEPAPILKQKVEKGELGFKTGRGFQEWDQEKMQKSKTQLLEYLIKWNREHKETNSKP